MILNEKKLYSINNDNFKHTVELVKTFGTTPTVDKGSQSQDDLLRRRRQHIARLNIPKSSTSRALSRFSRNSTAIFCGKSTSANLSLEDRYLRRLPEARSAIHFAYRIAIKRSHSRLASFSYKV